MLCFPIWDHVMVPWRNLSSYTRASTGICTVCIAYEITNGTFPVKASRGPGANWPVVEVAQARNMSIGEHRRPFTVLYFSVRSSRSSALRFKLHLAWVSKLLRVHFQEIKMAVINGKTRYISTLSRKNWGLWTVYEHRHCCVTFEI